MNEITRLLQQAAEDQEGALDEVFHRLHGELSILARSRLSPDSNLTLTPTGLVNELYLKFSGAEQLSLESQHHFFACAASAMRQIIIDAVRSAKAGKRGSDLVFVTLADPEGIEPDTQVLELDDAMNRLQQVDTELRELVELKYFAGLSMDQIANLKQRSPRSLQRDWLRARAFLHAQLAT
jgi:RNA polymerase sigma factor (TIGR02999 family)